MGDVVVKDGVTCLYVRKGKTDAATRYVPCCDTVSGIVEELSMRAGARDTGSLFEVKHQLVYRTLRAALGDDHSVDLHSLRRSFITIAEHAGCPVHTIESVVGHKRQGQTRREIFAKRELQADAAGGRECRTGGQRDHRLEQCRAGLGFRGAGGRQTGDGRPDRRRVH